MSASGSVEGAAGAGADAARAAGARGVAGRLVRGSLTYGASDFVQKAVSFVLIPVYTRHLTTADYGIVGILSATASLAAVVLGMGLRSSVVRQYYDYRSDPRALARYLGTVLWLVVGGGSAVAAALSLWGRPLFERVFDDVPFAPFVPLTLWTALFTATGTVLLSLYRAREQALRYAALQIGSLLLSSAAILHFVVVRGDGAHGFATGLFLASGALFLGYLALAAREASWRFSADKARAALAYGLPLVPHLLAASVLAAMDRIVLERITSLDQVGLYTLGYQIGMVVGLVAASINSAWTPIFYDRARAPDAARTFARVFTPYAAGLAWLAGALALFAREIVSLLAADAYGGAAAVVPIVAAGYLCQGLYFMLSTPIFYARRTHLVALASVSAALLDVVLVVAWAPRMGIAGAAYATLASFALLAAAAFAIARRLLPIPYEARKLAVVAAVFGSSLLLAPVATLGSPGGSAALKAAILCAQVALLFGLRVVSIEALRASGRDGVAR
jgi:O-antigen/teichoic acid export membrane protein